MPETLKYLSKEQRDAIDNDPTSIPNLQIALARNPADLASRELLITRLKAGKLPGEASAQQTYLDFLRGGGSPIVVQLSELLVDELESRGTVYRPEYSPPVLPLVSPGRDPVELVHDGGELAIVLPGCRLTVDMMPVSTIAGLICPFPGSLPDDLEWAWDYLDTARAIAYKMFGDDTDARDVAERAVIRCAEIFNGWGNFSKLAKSFVRSALRSCQRKLAKKRRMKSLPDEYWQTAAEQTSESARRSIPGRMRGTGGRWEPLAQSNKHAIDLDALLETLPPNDREIIERHYLREESTETIAASLGVSVRTIQRSISRSIAALQDNSKNL